MKAQLERMLVRLLSDPLNERICMWALAVAGTLFFGNLIIHYLIQNL